MLYRCLFAISCTLHPTVAYVVVKEWQDLKVLMKAREEARFDYIWSSHRRFQDQVGGEKDLSVLIFVHHACLP